MKKILTLVAILATVLALGSCSSYPDTPTEVANKVLEAVDKDDLNALKKYCILVFSYGQRFECDDPEYEEVIDEFLKMKTVHNAIHYQKFYAKRPKRPIGEYKFLMEEISEDGNEAFVWFFPKENFSEEMKTKISSVPWRHKSTTLFGEHIRINLIKTSAGKWKVTL